jgi:hypothetical protein
MRAYEVFHQNDGEVTKAYYAELNGKGLIGQLACALFRAQKRSSAAKRYKGGKYRHAAYDVKNWSLSEVCRILTVINKDQEFLFGWAFNWGWKEDPNTPVFSHVLYVDLPQGQWSAHSASRLDGPNYLGEWDGLDGASEARILAFCDSLAGL